MQAASWQNKAQQRIKLRFKQAQAAWPPKKIVLLALKQERRLELWASLHDKWFLIHIYPILGASGTAGPKLRQGDKQVPEGSYNILWLNPKSRFHLSMKLDYPNAEDRKHARKEGRKDPGGDIFIHGKDVSIGCIAIGDPAIEELYTLVQRTGVKQVSVYIVPTDPRQRPLSAPPQAPAWLDARYQQLNQIFQQFQ
ncbi:MAG: L,D-transpeptidase family protein [Pseudomonadota bacterium]|nr:L,D-transpeptidase family protein [Pseudomonadota bacterium]